MIGLCEDCLAHNICILRHRANEGNDEGVIFTASLCSYYRHNTSSNINNTQQDKADEFLDMFSLAEKMHAVNEASKKFDSLITEDNTETIEKQLDEETKCAICGTKTRTLIKCDGCGRWGCDECMTNDVNGKTMCPDCF